MLNAIVKKQNYSKFIINEEGYKVYKRNPDVDLFLHACGFSVKNSYYHNNKEKLDYIISLLDKNDKDYIEALSWYLGSTMGLRLIPTIMTTELALRAKTDEDWQKISFIVRDVFTRPDFIANACGYIKYKYNIGSFMGALPDRFKKILKTQLESFSELTLKKMKMKRRSIKLADLIKTLRPRPKNQEMSRLYKAIIENNNYASLKVEIDKSGRIVKADHITSVLSKQFITTIDEKKKYINENIKNLPLNALLKNITLVDEEYYINLLKDRLLHSVKNGVRILNPYDLLMIKSDLHKYSCNEVSEQLLNMLDDVFITALPKFNNIIKPVILYDISGSMIGQPHVIGTKFITTFLNLFKKDFKFYTFNNTCIDVTNIIKKMNLKSPNKFASTFVTTIKQEGGTSLLDAIEKVVKENHDCDLFIIITDEVTWADDNKIEHYKKLIPNRLYNKVILFNANPAVGSVFKPSSEIVRLSGLNRLSFNFVNMLFDFDEFKKQMINKFKEVYDEKTR